MSRIGDKCKELAHASWRVLHSSRGKDALLFLLFLCVSAAFWMLLTLNNEVQEDLEVPFTITNIPDSITIISNPPKNISVSIRDKGSSLARFVWGTTPSMSVDYDEFQHSETRLSLGETDIDSRLRSLFGSTSQIISSKPDSISLLFTSRPGRKVKVNLKVEAYPTLQSIVSGPITVSPDSVTVFSVNDLPATLTQVETVPVIRTELSDTTYIETNLVFLSGTRIEPDHVTIRIPVEPLIAKRRHIPVSVIGVPKDLSVLTFPAQVEISYLVPMSKYSTDEEEGFAVGDFSRLMLSSAHRSPKMAIHLMGMPSFYKNIVMETDSVEYIIDQKHPY